MALVELTPQISYLPASEKPLSCDIVFIKTNKATWIFDAGLCKEAAAEINKIEGPKNIVISHFHIDHIMNLPRVSKDKLYVTAYTKKYTLGGEVIKGTVTFDEDPEITIMELPSSHAKGCLVLVCGDYAFLGDGAYSRPKKGNHTYNAQLLQQMIQTMEGINANYFCLSHDENFVQKKEDVISLYKEIYKRRAPDNPLIDVEDFFSPDGSVKKSDN